MSTIVNNCLPPSFEEVREAQITLKDYYTLYMHYAYSTKLPTDFPESILKEFPNKSYKRELKGAIIRQTAIVKILEEEQNNYLHDYYTLYMHYAYSTKLPEDFPECVLAQFPSKNYKGELKQAIINLQNAINKEKTPPVAVS